MKRLLSIIAAILMAFSASASGEYKVVSTWKSKDAESSKRYIAIVRYEDNYEDGDLMMVFGNKEGKLKKRIFGLHGGRFYSYDGARERSSDDFYKLESQSIGRDNKLAVTLTPRIKNWKTHKMTYNLHNSEASIRFAQSVLKIVLAEKNEVLANKNPKTLKDFKKVLQTIKTFSSYWDHSYDYQEPRENFLFPLYDLQIEYGLKLSMPDKALASASINSKGTDLITKTFRKSEKWSESTNQVEDEISSILEHNRSIRWDDPNHKEVGTFSLYRKGSEVEGFTKKWIKDAAKKFVKYEIQTISGYDCEDSDIFESDFAWILNDGSVFSYHPTTECD